MLADILNQQSKMYTSLSQVHSDVKMVQSLIPIWEVCFILLVLYATCELFCCLDIPFSTIPSGDTGRA